MILHKIFRSNIQFRNYFTVSNINFNNLLSPENEKLSKVILYN